MTARLLTLPKPCHSIKELNKNNLGESKIELHNPIIQFTTINDNFRPICGNNVTSA